MGGLLGVGVGDDGYCFSATSLPSPAGFTSLEGAHCISVLWEEMLRRVLLCLSQVAFQQD